MTDQMNRMTSCNKMMESMMNSGSSGYPVCTENLNPDVERWSRFLRQAVKVDSTMQGMIHDEDAETLFSGVQGQGCA